MAEEGFIDIMKTTKLPPEAVDYIQTNPEGLTKEGAEFNYRSWKADSKNKYTTKKYESMVKYCKSFTPSGKTTNGETILSRGNDGKPTWVAKVD